MKPADDIRRLFRTAGVSTNPAIHEKVFADVLRARQQTMEQSPARPAKWRHMMRHPTIRYGAAAVATLAAVVAFGLYSRTGSVTWAIERSIAATDRYRAILLEGFMLQPGKDGEPQQHGLRSWAVANDEQTKVEKERIEVDGVPILVVNGQRTWRYDPQTSTVVKNRPYGMAECWCGSRFLEQLKGFHEAGVLTRYEVTQGRDAATGKPRVVLACAWLDGRYNGPRSLRLEFDTQTSLLTRFEQWENADWQGTPRLVGEKITYHESLPDELFEFEVPAGATVVEE